MKYSIEYSTQFKRDIRKVKRRGCDLNELFDIVEMLANDIALPERNHDHPLIGKYAGCRECHIRPDWLLIYEKTNEIRLVSMLRTGSHSDLF